MRLVGFCPGLLRELYPVVPTEQPG
jgi:hypothetical protein